MKQTSQLKLGSILSYLQMALGVVIGLLYTPAMIRLLGKSEYGLYSTVTSAISMLSVLSLGFNSSYIRFYSKYQKEHRLDAIYRLNGLFLIIFSVLGLVALGCGVYLSGHLSLVFDEGLTQEEYATARVLMLLLTLNLAISLPMSVFSSIISAHEKFVFLKLVNILRTVLSPLLTLPLLLMGYRSVAVVTVTLSVYLISDVLYLYFVLFRLKERFRFRGIVWKDFTSLFAFTFFIAINILVDQINWNIDKLLLGRFRGTQVVAVYSVGYTLYTYFQMFSTAVSEVFSPRIHRIVNETAQEPQRQRQLLSGLFTQVGRIQFLILSLIAGGMVFFGTDFLGFWVGAGYEGAYYILLLLALPSMTPLIQNVGIEIQRAKNLHRFRSIAYLIMALINLLISYFLCQSYGAIGCAVGTAFSLLLANGPIINLYYHKRCNLDIPAFWKSIARIVPGLLPSMVFGTLIKAFVPIASIWSFLALGGAYCLIYCLCAYFFSMNAYEKGLLRQTAKKLLRKK